MIFIKNIREDLLKALRARTFRPTDPQGTIAARATGLVRGTILISQQFHGFRWKLEAKHIRRIRIRRISQRDVVVVPQPIRQNQLFSTLLCTNYKDTSPCVITSPFFRCEVVLSQ